MTITKRQLDQKERDAVAFGLRIAAEQYQTHAATIKGAGIIANQNATHGLTKQFERQQVTALELADLIDNAAAITIETEDEA